MNKSIILFAAIFLSACTPVLMTLDQPFVKVFEEIPGSQSELYLKANDWMVGIFTDAESVIQYSDKEEGVIIGRYLFHGQLSRGLYNIEQDNRIYAKINLTLRDGRARIEITPEEWKYDSSGMTIYNLSKEEGIARMEEIAESFRQALLSKAIEF